MVWPWMHFIVGVVLIVAVVLGLLTSPKQSKIWAMVARVCYLLILLSGVLLFSHGWEKNPVLLVVKIVVALVFIGLAEMGFAKKSRGQADVKVLWIPVVLGVVVFALGLVLTQGFPLVM